MPLVLPRQAIACHVRQAATRRQALQFAPAMRDIWGRVGVGPLLVTPGAEGEVARRNLIMPFIAMRGMAGAEIRLLTGTRNLAIRTIFSQTAVGAVGRRLRNANDGYCDEAR